MSKRRKRPLKTNGDRLDTLTWLGDYPLLRNKTVAISILVVSTLSVGLVWMFLVWLAVNEGNYQHLGMLLKVFGGLWFGFTLALFLIAAIFFGGKIPMEVIIDRSGVTQIQRSKRATATNRLAIIVGLLSGGARGATTAGAGAIAATRQIERVRYSDLRWALGDPRTGEIRLWDDWHTVMQVFAPLEHYPDAMCRIQAGIAQAAQRRLPPSDIPVAIKLLVSLGALVLGSFLLADFPLAFPFWGVALMVAWTLATVFSNPAVRSSLGWGLAFTVALSVAALFRWNSANLEQEGAVMALAIQLAVIAVFICFGACAGLGMVTLRNSE